MADQQAWANRVAFAFLAASAGVQALQQAMKDAPDIASKSWAPDINLGNWNYLPLALVSIGVLAWLYQQLSIGKRAQKITAPNASADFVQREIPTPPAPPTSTSERIFLDPAVKYSDLIGSLHGKTDIQKNALCRPHIGKWMRVSGIFNDVSEIRNGELLAFVMVEDEIVSFLFEGAWRDQITSLSVGDLVSIDGRIKSFTSGARFDLCELVDVRTSPS